MFSRNSLITLTAWCCTLLFAPVSLSAAQVWSIDPEHGDDAAAGTEQAPWKSFEPLNKLTLHAGDRVVVSPGTLTATLAPKAEGSAANPVRIEFRQGEYHWQREGLVKKKLAISNTNDRPDEEKAIAMDWVGAEHLRVSGKGALFFCHGKMVQIHMELCRDIRFSGFAFDYARPTVSEYKAVEVTPDYALLEIHPDSPYRLADGKLTWLGEGWELPANEGWAQTVQADGKRANRGGPAPDSGTLTEVAPRLLRCDFSAEYKKRKPGVYTFREGCTYQHRSFVRDCCGVFCDRSADIVYDGVTFHFMHGMGIVSQFSRDISIRRLTVAPRKESGRTSAAWADILHFSGCAGRIRVEDSLLTCANDDAMNVHGTHLRLVRRLSGNRVVVRFMHPQTWGFPAFFAGDEVQITAADTMQSLGSAVVKTSALLGDGHEMELALDRELPEGVRLGHDVLENVTYTPAVSVDRCTIRHITTRGFLLTTRRPIRITNTVFDRTGMSALLMENDAEYWFESGPVKDMEVRGCTFIECATPIVNFNPHNSVHGGAVHENGRILNNTFILRKADDCALHARSSKDILFRSNRFPNFPAWQPERAQMLNSEHITIIK